MAVVLSGPAAAQDKSAEAQNYITACTGNVPVQPGTTCEFQRAEFLANYQLAYHGEYTGQRNVAFCFRDGCDGAVKQNPVQSCAWRLVVVGSGHPQFDAGDSSHTRSACGKLSGADLATAEARSRRILSEINPLPPAQLKALRDRLIDAAIEVNQK